MVFYNSRWKQFEGEFEVPNAPFPTIHDGEASENEHLPPVDLEPLETVDAYQRDEAYAEEIAHLMPRNTRYSDGIRALQRMERDRQQDWQLRLRVREFLLNQQRGILNEHALSDGLVDGVYESSVSESDSDDMDDEMKNRKRPLSMEGMATRGDNSVVYENENQPSSAGAKLQTESKRRRVEYPKGDMVHLCDWLEKSATIENPRTVPDLLPAQPLDSSTFNKCDATAKDDTTTNEVAPSIRQNRIEDEPQRKGDQQVS